MSDNEQASQRLEEDAKRLTRCFDEAPSLSKRKLIKQRLYRAIKFTQHRRNLVITISALMASIIGAAFLLLPQHKVEDGISAIFAVSSLIFIAIFIVIHDPDY